MRKNRNAIRPYQPGRGQPYPSQKGFTLLEVLIVITIVGIIVGVTTLSFGAIDQRRLASEASHLRLVFDQAADSALMKQQTLGWFYHEEENNYWFSLLDESGEWTAPSNPLFAPYRIDPPTTILVELPSQTTDTALDDEEPTLLFLSSGEYTPFELKVKDGKYSPIKLKGDGFGEITTVLDMP